MGFSFFTTQHDSRHTETQAIRPANMNRESRGNTAGVRILSPGDGAPLGLLFLAPPGVQYSIPMGRAFNGGNVSSV